MGCVEGEPMKEIKQEIKEKALFMYITDCIVYYPFMYCVTRFAPVRYRMVMDHMFGFCWCIFLSFVKYHDINEKLLTLQRYFTSGMEESEQCSKKNMLQPPE